MKNAIFLIESLCGLKYIATEDMVVLTVAKTENPCTVCFNEPLLKADFVRCLSCSLRSSWLNLKQSGIIKVSNLLNPSRMTIKGFPPGYYTNQKVAKTLDSLFGRLGAQKNNRRGGHFNRCSGD